MRGRICGGRGGMWFFRGILGGKGVEVVDLAVSCVDVGFFDN